MWSNLWELLNPGLDEPTGKTSWFFCRVGGPRWQKSHGRFPTAWLLSRGLETQTGTHQELWCNLWAGMFLETAALHSPLSSLSTITWQPPPACTLGQPLKSAKKKPCPNSHLTVCSSQKGARCARVDNTVKMHHHRQRKRKRASKVNSETLKLC